MDLMEMKRLFTLWVVLGGLAAVSQQADATFHFMQIEQVIGGVNGDTSAQAIQLRMRSGSQQFVAQGRVRAWDAAGLNPIVVADLPSNVAVGQTGRRVLITSTAFDSLTDVPVDSDFTMDNLIPESYLNAGRLTFENNAGNVLYWVLAWGGAGYTGPTTGIPFPSGNDADGEYGPPFVGALPSTSLQALQFQGAASALSTNNAADYAITAGASTWTNNANASFTLVDPPLPDSADFDDDDDVDGVDFLTWQRNAGGTGAFEDGDANHDGDINGADLAIWETQYNTPPPLLGLAAVPEPHAATLLVCGLLVLRRQRRQRV